MLRRVLKRQVALPTDHGTWAFFLSPLLIGLLIGGRFSGPSFYLVVAASSGFLLRQPITILVKIASKRRGRGDLGVAAFWSALYLGIALIHLVGLLVRGFSFVLVLALPGVLVFCWYLALVARRDERRQKGVEIVGAGVLALSAPAAYWIALERLDPIGWILWALCWIFSAMSIIHVYSRLEQRALGSVETGLLRRPARKALAVNTLLALAAQLLSTLAQAPVALALPFLLQWAESAQAAFERKPPPRPTAIGLRQLVVAALFTTLFVLIWSSAA